MINTSWKTSFSQAETVASIAFLIAILLFLQGSWMAAIPLICFLFLCTIAPFCPQWGFFLPIISSSTTDSPAVALTFDDGPSPVSTPIILKLLKHYNYKATFFVIGSKAEQYPELITEIIKQGHSIGNHSWKHDYLLMLKSSKYLQQDIAKTQVILQKSGIYPLVFRPPSGITNPRLKSILQDENLHAVTFSCRPFDHGNKNIVNLAKRIMDKLKAGDIILLHDIDPGNREQLDIWEQELHNLLLNLQKSSHDVLELEVLIGIQVMKKCN